MQESDNRFPWFGTVKRPLVIAGPCSAETEEQLFETCSDLAKTGLVDIFRAGIWKPRTRPDSFEGVGEIGLEWIKNVKQEIDIPFSIEVANVKHVEKALASGVDVLWIGARTTVNPFSVQELAESLKGVDIPVMIKNPINSDLSLWIGAVERFQKAGLNKLSAIHRGFSFYGEKRFRNRPQWQIPIDFTNHFPEIPMICDPSHICGNRELLAYVSQKAMDLGFDGLMIEVHRDPDNAWSDAKQQIKADRFKDLMESLVIRDLDNKEWDSSNNLEDIRKEIDRMDDELIAILSQRMSKVRNIGEFKKDNNVAIFQAERWRAILKKFYKLGDEHGLSKEFISRFIKAIHDESIEQQTKIMNESPKD